MPHFRKRCSAKWAKHFENSVQFKGVAKINIKGQ